MVNHYYTYKKPSGVDRVCRHGVVCPHHYFNAGRFCIGRPYGVQNIYLPVCCLDIGCWCTIAQAGSANIYTGKEIDLEKLGVRYLNIKEDLKWIKKIHCFRRGKPLSRPS